MSAADALWLAGYIAAGDEAGQREVVAAGAVPELVRHLGSRERQRVIPALRATGNLALGDSSMVSGSHPTPRSCLSCVPCHANNRRLCIVKPEETCRWGGAGRGH